MASRFWARIGGGIITDDIGRPVLCEYCPCVAIFQETHPLPGNIRLLSGTSSESVWSQSRSFLGEGFDKIWADQDSKQMDIDYSLGRLHFGESDVDHGGFGDGNDADIRSVLIDDDPWVSTLECQILATASRLTPNLKDIFYEPSLSLWFYRDGGNIWKHAGGFAETKLFDQAGHDYRSIWPDSRNGWIYAHDGPGALKRANILGEAVDPAIPTLRLAPANWVMETKCIGADTENDWVYYAMSNDNVLSGDREMQLRRIRNNATGDELVKSWTRPSGQQDLWTIYYNALDGLVYLMGTVTAALRGLMRVDPETGFTEASVDVDQDDQFMPHPSLVGSSVYD